MKTYKLKRPFDDGRVVHPRGTIIQLDKAPKSAVEISAKEIAAEKAKLSTAEEAVKSAERAELKAELMAEIRAELLANPPTEDEVEAAAAAKTEAETAKTEADAANATASAVVTGGVDNDGKPLKEATAKTKPPVQKAGGK